MSVIEYEAANATPSRAGKYLTFGLGKEGYGLQILKVREIIGYMDITAVPQTPAYVRGVINLRGQVISIVDLRSKFGMPAVERTEETCIIVVEIAHGDRTISMGIVVDRVAEVISIAANAIEPAPRLGGGVDHQFILGLAKVGQAVKILLDIDRVLRPEELERIETIEATQKAA